MQKYVSSEELTEKCIPESRSMVRKLSLMAKANQFLIRMEMLKRIRLVELSVTKTHLILARKLVMTRWEWVFTVIIHLRTERLAESLTRQMLQGRVPLTHCKNPESSSAMMHTLKKMVWMVINRMPLMYTTMENRSERSLEGSLLPLLISILQIMMI